MYSLIRVNGAASLAGNRFGDPVQRDVGVLLPPGYEGDGARRYPVVICLAGYASTGPILAEAHHALDRPLHAQLSDRMASGDMPTAIILFPDCATRYGGSQYIDSPNAGGYQSFLCDDLLSRIDGAYRTIADPRARIVVGRSSGGYGAIRALIDRPDAIGAAGALAPDCLFEHCYLPFFSAALDYWAAHGGYGRFARLAAPVASLDHRFMLAMSLIGMASVYSPLAQPGPDGAPFRLPYDPDTGVFDPLVWAEWKRHDLDTLLRAAPPARLQRCGPLSLRVGTMDEYNMQISARFLRKVLKDTPIRLDYGEFDGFHGGNSQVMADMIAGLLDRLDSAQAAA